MNGACVSSILVDFSKQPINQWNAATTLTTMVMFRNGVELQTEDITIILQILHKVATV